VPDRAAIVTGASRGIGFALADALGEEGYGPTVSARKPDTLVQAAEELRAKGYEVEQVAANMAHEDAIREVVARHRDRFGRLDVLVNNAGVGIGAAAADHQTKELNADGIKSVALCPGFVDTDMTEFIRGTVPVEEMLRTTDITAALRFLLHVSPACVVPEIIFQRPGEAI
jgi:NAD(P)-dependent dehydrogenase (short-subunit alcohol dehydrogenase family)